MAVPSPVPPSPWDCLRHEPPRRRIFWTTQLEACEAYTMCGHECALPGLVYEDSTDPHLSTEPAGRTIRNTNWLNGLILNILNTRARNDIACPTPAATYGHWSESYRDDGIYVGSKFWNAAEKSYTRVNDGVQAIGAVIKADLSKLIQMQVANSVEVEAFYGGANIVEVTVKVTSPVSGEMVINLAGAFVSGGWEWR